MVERTAVCTCGSGICATHLQMQSSAELTASLSRWKDCLGDDLRLAAELGKILLDRNKLLEDELDALRSSCLEKDVQVEVLRKQVIDLRDLNTNKDTMLLEAESYSQETETVNRALLLDVETYRKQLRRLKNRFVSVEQQRNDLLFSLRNCTCQDPLSLRSQRELSSEYSIRHTSPSPSRFDHRELHITQPWDFFIPHHQQKYRVTMTTASEKEFYIDDELDDQPDLSAACIAPTCSQPCLCTFLSYSDQCSSNHHPSNRTSMDVIGRRIKRSSSWPPSGSSRWRNDCEICCDTDYVWSRHPTISEEPSNCKEERESNSPQNETPQAAKFLLPANSRPEDLKTLSDLLDDASFIHRLEAIYHMKYKYGFPPRNHRPRYKQLFQDAFSVIHSLKSKSVRQCNETTT